MKNIIRNNLVKLKLRKIGINKLKKGRICYQFLERDTCMCMESWKGMGILDMDMGMGLENIEAKIVGIL